MGDHPPVGIYSGVPAGEYHAWPLPSSTLLNELWRRSPAHVREIIKSPRSSDAFAFGSAVHTLALEGEAAYLKRYAVGGPINPVTNACFGRTTKKFLAWAAEHTLAGRECLTTEDDELVRGVVRSIEGHSTATWLLRESAGHRETSIVFRPYSDLDVLCKCRLDAVAEKFDSIVDIKTCASAAWIDAQQSIVKWGYHRQAALYLMGCASLQTGIESFIWIFAESASPFGIGTYRLDSESRAVGESQVRELLELWAKCERDGRWPAYDDEVIDIGLPPWARKQTLASRRGLSDPFGGE